MDKKKRKDPRTILSVQRLGAKIKVKKTEEIIDCRVFLSDLNPSGVGLFINQPFEKGEEVSILIEYPRHLYVNGEVAWCSPHTLHTKVISPEQYQYRMGIRFQFNSPEEKEALINYCEELFAKKAA